MASATLSNDKSLNGQPHLAREVARLARGPVERVESAAEMRALPGRAPAAADAPTVHVSRAC